VLPEPELHQILLDIPLVSITGPWTRAIEHVHVRKSIPEPLWAGSGSSRFSPEGAFRRLYLSSDFQTALKEAKAIFHLHPIRTAPWVLITVDGFLQNVLDLTSEEIWDHLGTSISELTGNWDFAEKLYRKKKTGMPPTQLLGKAAFETGRIAGLSFHAAQNPGDGTNLVVFPDRLVPAQSSYLEVFDPHRLLRAKLP
jgi:hypothetical protein